MNNRSGSVPRLLSAVASDSPLPLTDESVRYVSRGVVLLLGPADLIVGAARKLARSTRVVACSADLLPPGSARANPLFIPCRIRAVHGHLGQFRVDAEDLAGKPVDLAPFSPAADGIFDLVLDLSPAPLCSAQLKAPGYFSPPPAEVDAVMEEMLALKGSFRKPRFVRYEAALCTHGAQGIKGCTRCLAVCPAQAIVSTGERIAVDAHLCQGCSSCTLVCPSGALSPAEPDPQALLKTLAALAQSRHERLCIHVAGAAPSAETGGACLAVPALAAAGADIWLSALALGFSQVLLQLPAALAPASREAIAAQIERAHELLAALGLPAACIVSDEAIVPAPAQGVRRAPGARLPAYAGKRAQLIWACATLQQRADGAVALKPGADMGGIVVDAASCTLCLACSQLCPTGALQSPAGHAADLRLEFIESACVQCGLCERGCPERAITLQPRLLLGAGQAVVLHRERQHACPQCGKPFISVALLARATQLMRRQGGLDEAAMGRLGLCPECRLQAIMQPPDQSTGSA